jgi:hypothetical protein
MYGSGLNWTSIICVITSAQAWQQADADPSATEPYYSYFIVEFLREQLAGEKKAAKLAMARAWVKQALSA